MIELSKNIKNLPISKIIDSDDAFQVVYYNVNYDIEKIISNYTTELNCDNFRINNFDWLQQQENLLNLPDAIIMTKTTKLSDEQLNLLTKYCIQVVYVDDNILIPDVFQKLIKSIIISIIKGRQYKYIEIEKSVIKNIEDKYTDNPENNEEQTKKLIGEILELIKEKDDVTYKHVKNVSDYVDIFLSGLPADKMMSEEDVKFLKNAALLHDIGKLTIPNRILKNTGNLNDSDYESMKFHVDENAFLFDNDLLNKYKEVALCHHERYDGSGYPNGLAGDNIPYFARILAVLDSFEAMTGNREYVKKNQKSIEEALNSLMEGAKKRTENNPNGGQYDPNIVKTFITGIWRNHEMKNRIIEQLEANKEQLIINNAQNNGGDNEYGQNSRAK